ncbi:hypothetical protein Bca101_054432 [Brassica carinata]
MLTTRRQCASKPRRSQSDLVVTLLLKTAGNHKSTAIYRRSEEIDGHGFLFETLRFNLKNRSFRPYLKPSTLRNKT